MAEAARRLPEYLKVRPIDFYPWLRQLAWNRLVDLYRFHIEVAKRSVNREAASDMGLSNESVMALARRLVTTGTSPSQVVLRKELQECVRMALGQLPETYREVLVMRHMEQLSIKEIAVVVGIVEGTVKSRLFRGMEQLHELLGGLSFGAER
jgi:RNA polymerase sigma-70 factor (ECF subfamily)